MSLEKTRLRAKLDRDIVVLDQKIEAQNEKGRAVNDALHDLYGARSAVLAAYAALDVREAAE